MKFVIAFLFALGCSSLFAAPPTPASIERLLTLTGSQKMLDAVYQQMDGYLHTTLNQMMANNQKLTPADREKMQKSIDEFANKATAIYREELTWPKLQKMYTQIYSDTFSQEEIDGLIAFYESPAGKAYVEKMPLIMQKTMGQMQQLVVPITQRIQALSQEFAKSTAPQSGAQGTTP